LTNAALTVPSSATLTWNDFQDGPPAMPRSNSVSGLTGVGVATGADAVAVAPPAEEVLPGEAVPLLPQPATTSESPASTARTGLQIRIT
jgi:hypothetical protein